jgi:roadblock/LC7 domain-containing protein
MLVLFHQQKKERNFNIAKSLDELLKLKGVVTSGEFSADGKVNDFRSKNNELSPEVADLTAQFAAAVSQPLGTLAVAHSKISGFNWIPEQGAGRGECEGNDARIGL